MRRSPFALFVLATPCLLLCAFTIETSLRGRLLDRKTGKAVGNTLIVVKQGGYPIGTARTGNKGKFAIDFNVGSGESADDTTAWLYFYAVRKPLDTVLLERFYSFPERFKEDGDQRFKADLYMP